MADVEFDKKDQYERVAAELLPGESLHAVYDLKGAGSGFLGISNKRVIFQDRQRWGGRESVFTSLPYSRVSYISSEVEERRMGRSESKLALAVGSHAFEFEFWGTDKAIKAQRWILSYLIG